MKLMAMIKMFLVAVFATSFGLLFSTPSPQDPPIVRGAGDSPVMASGGSMTFRSKNGWTCDTPNSTKHHSCFATLPSPHYLYLDGGDKSFPTSKFKNWAVVMSARGFGTTNGTTGQVKLCSSVDGQKCSAKGDTAITGVLVTHLGHGVKRFFGNGTLEFVDSLAVESGTFAFQYRDSGCNVHSDKHAYPDCEHPGEIDLSDLDAPPSTTYHCRNGQCRVYIDIKQW